MTAPAPAFAAIASAVLAGWRLRGAGRRFRGANRRHRADPDAGQRRALITLRILIAAAAAVFVVDAVTDRAGSFVAAFAADITVAFLVYVHDRVTSGRDVVTAVVAWVTE